MNYELSQLFSEAFGLELDKKENTPNSYLGTPIIDPITFKGGKYETCDVNGNRLDKNGDPILGAYQDFTLPASSIVDVRRKKIIQRTQIAGHLGSTVKEIFGFDDWRITIRGLILSDPSQKQGLKTTEKQIKELNRWDKILSGITVQGKPFALHQIDAISIEQIRIDQWQGRPDTFKFIIQALGTETLESIIQEVKE